MKKNHLKYQFLCFFHNIGQIFAQILPWRPHPLYFSWLIFNECVKGIATINIILITCVAIQKLWKKVGKTSQKLFFGPNLHRKEVIMGHTQDGNFFLADVTKADHQLSESFYFIKISYVLTELWIFFYLEWCFLFKKVSFPAKTAVQ